MNCCRNFLLCAANALVTGNLKHADDVNRHHLELARIAILKRMKGEGKE